MYHKGSVHAKNWLLSSQEDYVFIGVRLSICLSVCLSVCLLARLLKKLWTDFDENFRKCQKCQILVAISGLFVCLLAYYSKTYKWISMKFSGKIEDGTNNKPLNFGSDPWQVCLLAYYSKTYEWISMKFSVKIEGGPSNELLNFGSDSWPWRRFVLSECTL